MTSGVTDAEPGPMTRRPTVTTSTLSTDPCPVCAEPLVKRPDHYYECPGCGAVYSPSQLEDLIRRYC